MGFLYNYVKTNKLTMVYSCCPYLGLANDRTILLMTETPVHRCYVQAKPFIPELTRQKNYCLVEYHVECPSYIPQKVTVNRNDLNAILNSDNIGEIHKIVERMVNPTYFCMQCGQPISKGARRRKLYCSVKCRVAYHRVHKR